MARLKRPCAEPRDVTNVCSYVVFYRSMRHGASCEEDGQHRVVEVADPGAVLQHLVGALDASVSVARCAVIVSVLVAAGADSGRFVRRVVMTRMVRRVRLRGVPADLRLGEGRAGQAERAHEDGDELWRRSSLRPRAIERNLEKASAGVERGDLDGRSPPLAVSAGRLGSRPRRIGRPTSGSSSSAAAGRRSGCQRRHPD